MSHLISGDRMTVLVKIRLLNYVDGFSNVLEIFNQINSLKFIPTRCNVDRL